jgi:hypothetical protein
MFGDNELVVNSSSHNALSFHCVCEAITSKFETYIHLPGKFNPAETLSKHWSLQVVYPILKPILFFSGNTADLLGDDGAMKGIT